MAAGLGGVAVVICVAVFILAFVVWTHFAARYEIGMYGLLTRHLRDGGQLTFLEGLELTLLPVRDPVWLGGRLGPDGRELLDDCRRHRTFAGRALGVFIISGLVLIVLRMPPAAA